MYIVHVCVSITGRFRISVVSEIQSETQAAPSLCSELSFPYSYSSAAPSLLSLSFDSNHLLGCVEYHGCVHVQCVMYVR